MYTWGYIKEATLAKMDLTVQQAIDMGLVNKMPFYANEAITQITAAVKPKRQYCEYHVRDKGAILDMIEHKYHFTDVSFLFDPPCDRSTLSADQIEALELYQSYEYIGEPTGFPDDFFAWSDDIVYKYCCDKWISASDYDYTTYGGNKVVFKHFGDYRFPYLAKWFKIYPDTQDNYKLDAPDDVLECLPSYIASQLYKIDDETKSAILRNEYEMMVARIDENSYSTNKTIDVGGDW